MTDAFAALAIAQREAPSNPQYQLTSAEFQGRTGALPRRVPPPKKVLTMPNLTPLVRAQAEALIGDLYAAGPRTRLQAFAGTASEIVNRLKR